MDEKMTFRALNDAGQQVEYEVLFTFDSEETNKSYMAYTDGSLDEDGNVRVFASSYTTSGDNTNLVPIETDKEWKIVETILKELQEQVTGETGK